MFKKMMLLALAVGALVAFAAPAVAQAQLYEIDGGGSKVPLAANAEVTATSTNLVTLATQLQKEFVCEKVTLHLTLDANGAFPHLSNAQDATTINCNVVITKGTAGTVSLGALEGSAVGATFIVGGFCHFGGNIPFHYETDSDVLTITGVDQFFSSNCGQGHMTGDFTLETSDGTPVFIS